MSKKKKDVCTKNVDDESTSEMSKASVDEGGSRPLERQGWGRVNEIRWVSSSKLEPKPKVLFTPCEREGEATELLSTFFRV